MSILAWIGLALVVLGSALAALWLWAACTVGRRCDDLADELSADAAAAWLTAHAADAKEE